MNNLKVRNLLTLITVSLVCLVAFILAGISIYNIKTATNRSSAEYENAMYNGYQLELKSQVQSAINVLQAEYNKIQTEGITEEEAKRTQPTLEFQNSLLYMISHFHKNFNKLS